MAPGVVCLLLALAVAGPLTAATQPPPPPPPRPGSQSASPPAPPATLAARPAPTGTISAPEGSAPVITDGIFSPDEWDDALRVRLYASATDGDRHGMLTWPPGTEERTASGWAELRLK